LGRIGTRHAQFFAQEKSKFDLVAGCDVDTQRAGEFKEEYHCEGYADYAEFLKTPDMELVIISTPSLNHVSNAEDALSAGKTVLLDKPIAVTTKDFERIRELDKKYKGKLFFLHNIRFSPAFQTIRKIIDNGLLGEVKFVKIRRHHGFSRRCDWQTLLSCGGGQLSCWGPHVIDHGLQLLRSPLKNIWGHLQLVNARGDADDQVKIMLVGENGVAVDLEISYMSALRSPYCTVYGNRGTLICQNDLSSEGTIMLKYIDPTFQFEEHPVMEGNYLKMASQGFGCDKEIPWIEEEVDVEPKGVPWDVWETETVRNLYKALRENVPFPVTSEQAIEVAYVIETVKKQNPQFKWL
jgi:predicted dehydrogenase